MKKALDIKHLLLILALSTVVSSVSFAKIGVGVGTGKIQVDEKLKAGMIYQLPPVTVLNTGDEKSGYVVTTAYREEQTELRPPKEWFIFTPEKFDLDPGQVQVVEIKLNLPLKTIPGDYFAYLEASPTAKSTTGVTTIGVAAASKLLFTVSPANLIQSVYYKVVSLWKVYQPWTGRGAIALGIIIALILFKKFFKIELNTKKPKKDSVQQIL
jgi:hypothetical protein